MQSRELLSNNTQKRSITDILAEKKVFIALGLVSLIILAGAVVFLSRGEDSPSVPDDQIVARNGIHWHPKLTIDIKGKKQEIPANIGIGAIHQRIHTHDNTGILHMEMNGLVTKDETKIGNFFRIWGKEFSSNKLFDKTNGADGTVKMSVNGRVNSKFENYEMRDGDKIEIRYE